VKKDNGFSTLSNFGRREEDFLISSDFRLLNNKKKMTNKKKKYRHETLKVIDGGTIICSLLITGLTLTKE
jgi:hypothetical protein